LYKIFWKKFGLLNKKWSLYRLFEIRAKEKCFDDINCYEYVTNHLLEICEKYNSSRSSEKRYTDVVISSRIIDFNRKKDVFKKIKLDIVYEEDEDKLLESLIEENSIEMVNKLITNLKQRKKISDNEILVYQYMLDGNSYKEISQILNIETTKVYNIKNNFLQKIKREYQKVSK